MISAEMYDRNCTRGGLRILEWIAVAVVLLSYIVGFLSYYPRIVTVTDEADYLGRAHALSQRRLEYQSVNLNPDAAQAASNRYPPGTSITIAPLFVIGGLHAAFAYPLLVLVALVLVTALWIHEQGHSPMYALLVLCFPSCLVLGRVSMSGMPSALLVVCGMLLFWRGIKGGWWYWFMAGFLAGVSLMFRETNCLIFFPLFAGTLLRRERKALGLIAGGLCGLGIDIFVSVMLSDSLIHGGRSMGFSCAGLLSQMPFYLAALLIFVPGGLVWVLCYRGRRYPELIITVLMLFFFFSAYNYSGQQSGAVKALILGPRFFIPLLPLLAFAASESVPRLSNRLLNWLPSRLSALLRCSGIAAVAVFVTGLALIAFAVHPYFYRWSEVHVRARDLVYAHTPDKAVIVTDLVATEKYINDLYGRRSTLQFDSLKTGDVAYQLQLHDAIWIVMLERSDSEFWKERSAEALAFVSNLGALPRLIVDETLSPEYRLRIWSLKRALPYEPAEGENPVAVDSAMTPMDGWHFRFNGFPIGAWWGPGENDAEMQAYYDAGFNVAMIGRYMSPRPNGDPFFHDRFGDAAVLQEHLKLCERFGMWAMLDSHTPNNLPWGGRLGDVGDNPYEHHAASLVELEWLCNTLAGSPALLGILLGDDRGSVDDLMAAKIRYMREKHSDLMPWICQNDADPQSLAEHGNPIFNLQIYPTLINRDDSAMQNALAYCREYAMMRRTSLQYGLQMWPMFNIEKVTGDSLARFPLYAGLAYGADGYWVFCYNNFCCVAPGVHDSAAKIEAAKTRMYPVISKANWRVRRWEDDLVGSRSAGLFSNTAASDTVAPGDGLLVESMSDYMLIGVLEKDGALLAMIVDARVSRKFNGLPRRSVKITFGQNVAGISVASGSADVKAQSVQGCQLSLELEAGEGQLVRLSAREGVDLLKNAFAR